LISKAASFLRQRS